MKDGVIINIKKLDKGMSRRDFTYILFNEFMLDSKYSKDANELYISFDDENDIKKLKRALEKYGADSKYIESVFENKKDYIYNMKKKFSRVYESDAQDKENEFASAFVNIVNDESYFDEDDIDADYLFGKDEGINIIKDGVSDECGIEFNDKFDFIRCVRRHEDEIFDDPDSPEWVDELLEVMFDYADDAGELDDYDVEYKEEDSDSEDEEEEEEDDTTYEVSVDDDDDVDKSEETIYEVEMDESGFAGDDEVRELWDNIIDYNVATEDELQLITNINGYSVDTLNDVIYAKTGYHDWDKYACDKLGQCEDEEDEYDDEDENSINESEYCYVKKSDLEKELNEGKKETPMSKEELKVKKEDLKTAKSDFNELAKEIKSVVKDKSIKELMVCGDEFDYNELKSQLKNWFAEHKDKKDEKSEVMGKAAELNKLNKTIVVLMAATSVKGKKTDECGDASECVKTNESVMARFAKDRDFWKSLNEGESDDSKDDDSKDDDKKEDDEKQEKDAEEETEEIDIPAVVVTVKKDAVEQCKKDMIDAGVEEDDIEELDSEDEDSDDVELKVDVNSIMALKDYLDERGIDLEEKLGVEIQSEDEEGDGEKSEDDDEDYGLDDDFFANLGNIGDEDDSKQEDDKEKEDK